MRICDQQVECFFQKGHHTTQSQHHTRQQALQTRRMVETAARLTDHVFPRLPIRQWVLSVPKPLGYYFFGAMNVNAGLL